MVAKKKVKAKVVVKKLVDQITLVSEKSLAEAWDSKDDTRFDRLYKKKYLV